MLNPVSMPSDVRTRIHRIYQRLATASSLEPGEEVNTLFGDLVRLSRCNAPDEVQSVLGDPIIEAIRGNLQQVCSRGECLLESHWAKRIVAADDPWRVLRSFPYVENYEQLARLEMGALSSLMTAPPKRVLFIGSGPLPLTSIVLAKTYGLNVCNIDVDPEACELGRAVALSLGLESRLQSICTDALAFDRFAEHDVVFLASLVGSTPQGKARVLEHVAGHVRPDALLVIRSAERLRTLLYPQVQLQQLGRLELLLEVHPHHEVINSILVARRAA